MTARQPPDPANLADAHAFMHGVAEQLLRGAEDPADAAQDGLVRVLSTPAQPTSDARPWLAAVVRNVVRTRARRAQLESDARVDRARRPREFEPSAADEAERAEVRRLVAASVEGLEEPYRSVLLARFFDGLSPAEAAARFDRPINTIHSQTRRGLERLRGDLDRRLGDDQYWLLLLLPVEWLRTAEASIAPPHDARAGGTLSDGADGATDRIRFGAGPLRAGAVAGAAALAALIWVLLPQPPPAEERVAQAPVEAATGASAPLAALADAPPAPSRAPDAPPAPVESAAAPEVAEPTIAVLVRDNLGDPIPRAPVLALRLLSAAERADLAAQGVQATSVSEEVGRTDEAGRLDLPVDRQYATQSAVLPGRDWLVLRSEVPDFAGADQLVHVPFPEAGGAEVEIVLQRGAATILAQILGSDGQGIGGLVQIGNQSPAVIAEEPGRIVLRQPATASTDPDGRLTLYGNARGQFPIRAIAAGYTATESWIDTRAGGTIEWQLQLEPGIAIDGRVTDAAGQPVPGARLTLEFRSPGGDHRGVELEADEGGRYRFDRVEPGRVWLAAFSPTEPHLVAGHAIDCEPGSTHTWSPRLSAEPAIELHVTDSSGGPVTDCFVSLDTVARDWRRTGRTDAAGRVAFRACPEGPFDAVFYRRSTSVQQALVPSLELEGIDRSDRPLAVELPEASEPITVEGSLSTVEDLPLPTGRVVLIEPGAVFERTIELGPGGRFEFEARPVPTRIVAVLDAWGAADLGEHRFDGAPHHDLGLLELPRRRSLPNPLQTEGAPVASKDTRLFAQVGAGWVRASPAPPIAPRLHLLPGRYRLAASADTDRPAFEVE